MLSRIDFSEPYQDCILMGFHFYVVVRFDLVRAMLDQGDRCFLWFFEFVLG